MCSCACRSSSTLSTPNCINFPAFSRRRSSSIMTQNSQLHHTIITECPEVSGCVLYTGSEENTTLEREIGCTSWGAYKLTYIRPDQYSPSSSRNHAPLLSLYVSVLILTRGLQIRRSEPPAPRAYRCSPRSANCSLPRPRPPPHIRRESTVRSAGVVQRHQSHI